MIRIRTRSLFVVVSLLAIALVACTGNEEGGGADETTTTPTSTEPIATQTATPSGDDPVSSDAPTPSATTAPDPVDYEQVAELAPIEEVEVLFLESFPVQHRLRVVSGLPSGCARFDRIEVERAGTTFEVTVWNLVPAPDQEIACTMIYGFKESSVDLGSDLEAGTEYTVHVNDRTVTFVAR